MRISKRADGYIHLAHLFVTVVVCISTRETLWHVVPWFAIGWHRAVSYLATGIAALIVLGPLVWVRRHYLQVEPSKSA